MNRTRFEEYIFERFKVKADYPFADDNETAVFRHKENRKWFGLAMRISPSKLGLSGEGEIEVVNLKCPPVLMGSFLGERGFYPAYHMNKAHWLSVCLEDNTDENKLKFLIDISFEATAKKTKSSAK